MCATAACTVKNTAVRLVRITCSKASSVGAAQRRAAGNAGIGEDDVELAEFLHALPDRGFGRGNVGGIGDDRERVRPKLLRGRIQRRLVAPGDDDARALRDEHARGRQPDAAVAAGDQRRLVLQSHDRLHVVVALLNYVAYLGHLV